MDPTGVLVIVVRVDQCLEIKDAEADWICGEWGVLMPGPSQGPIWGGFLEERLITALTMMIATSLSTQRLTGIFL